jgi:hypothetical protein
MKCLLVFIGQSFRDGSQLSINHDTMNSILGQQKASESHINFILNLISKNYNVDICINTYKSKYLNLLLDWYNIPNTVLHKINYYDKLLGLNFLLQTSIIDIKIDIYDFIYFIRIDLCLSQLFIDLFLYKPDKIIFPFRLWNKHKSDITPLCDVMVYVPKKFFNVINNIVLYHTMLTHYLTFLNNNDIELIINTIHDSDSEKDYNPLYYMVSRKRNFIWYSINNIIDKTNYNIISILNLEEDDISYNNILSYYMNELKLLSN